MSLPPQTDSPEQVLNIIGLKQHVVDLDGRISFDEYVSWVYSVHELLAVITSCWWWLRAVGGDYTLAVTHSLFFSHSLTHSLLRTLYGGAPTQVQWLRYEYVNCVNQQRIIAKNCNH